MYSKMYYASLCTLQKLMRHNGLGLLNGARGRNRTTDTRIFKPKLIDEAQPLRSGKSVKPTTAHQALSGRLSNLGLEAIR
ncbi:hypothetical protein AB838_18670 [Rhodobacteraceae bacterium (ex Bugula neritina AB1)]|nr:hypothetical protein AB838_18670 [Rhodobacteraceae bacterium (ex Bugula neritina AB1)]